MNAKPLGNVLGSVLLSLTLLAALALLHAPPTAAQQATLPNGTLPPERTTLAAERDNTLYEDAEGTLSNGAGPYLFAGETQNAGTRRAVLAFDVNTLPEGALITGVSLRLHVSKIPPAQGAYEFALHRLIADWGEGASNAGGAGGNGTLAQSGDATWIHRFYEEDAASALLWATPGGDFVAAPSATASVGDVGEYEWSSAGMVADVQAWVDDPSVNFGWVLVGNEEEAQSAKRFDSRENPNEAVRPVLVVDYVPPGVSLFLPLVERSSN